MSILIPDNYTPSKDEEYMNDIMTEYFKLKLEAWKEDLISQAERTKRHLKESGHQPDDLDNAQEEYNHNLELRIQDRNLKLLKKIDAALERTKSGEFGYCIKTGDKIGIDRLIARPIAEYTLEVQQKIDEEKKLIHDNHWKYD